MEAPAGRAGDRRRPRGARSGPVAGRARPRGDDDRPVGRGRRGAARYRRAAVHDPGGIRWVPGLLHGPAAETRRHRGASLRRGGGRDRARAGRCRETAVRAEEDRPAPWPVRAPRRTAPARAAEVAGHTARPRDRRGQGILRRRLPRRGRGTACVPGLGHAARARREGREPSPQPGLRRRPRGGRDGSEVHGRPRGAGRGCRRGRGHDHRARLDHRCRREAHLRPRRDQPVGPRLARGREARRGARARSRRAVPVPGQLQPTPPRGDQPAGRVRGRCLPRRDVAARGAPRRARRGARGARASRPAYGRRRHRPRRGGRGQVRPVPDLRALVPVQGHGHRRGRPQGRLPCRAVPPVRDLRGRVPEQGHHAPGLVGPHRAGTRRAAAAPAAAKA